MSHYEKTVSSETIYEGRILKLKRDVVELENGENAYREVVVHGGGVCVLAFDGEDNIYLVKQYRYPWGRELLEIPAGKLEAGEDPYECGKRELEEETGNTAEVFEKFAELIPTPAYVSELIHIYRAEKLLPSKQKLDEDEFLDIIKVPFKEALRMVLDGEITDAKTQTAILKENALRADRR